MNRREKHKRSRELLSSAVVPFKAAVRELKESGKITEGTNRAIEMWIRSARKEFPPKRVLRSMERAYRGGHLSAAWDALHFCADRGITPPAWAVKGWSLFDRQSHGTKSEGRPHRDAWIQLWRVYAVLQCEKQGRYGRSKQGDKYVRAARLLANLNPRLFAGLPVVASADAIKKSYLEFRRTRRLGDISSEFLGPALDEMLLTPVIEHLEEKRRTINQAR